MLRVGKSGEYERKIDKCSLISDAIQALRVRALQGLLPHRAVDPRGFVLSSSVAPTVLEKSPSLSRQDS